MPPAPLSIRVARIAGVDLYVHGTFLLLLLWVVVVPLSLGAGSLGTLTLLILFGTLFGSVVLHELGHALAARRLGVRPLDILLTPLGGMTRLSRTRWEPGREFWIALAGPVVNLALGGGFRLSAAVAGGAGAPAVALALEAFAWVNLALAALNLLPAFPMDGGKLLRAAVGSRIGFARATRLAARVGRVLAVGLAAVGLLADPLLILVALVVWTGATAEEQAAVRASRAREIVARGAGRRATRTPAPGTAAPSGGR